MARDPDPDSPSQSYPDQQDPKGPQGLGQNSPSCYNSKSLLGPLIKLKPLYLGQGSLEGKMARWRGLAQKPSGPKQAPGARGDTDTLGSTTGSPGWRPRGAQPLSCENWAGRVTGGCGGAWPGALCLLELV